MATNPVGARALRVLAAAVVCAVPVTATGVAASIGSAAASPASSTSSPTTSGMTTPAGPAVSPTLFSDGTRIAAGGNHTCALVTGGQARCWGANYAGQLGNASVVGFSSTPVAVTGLSGATRISGGGNHTCALVAGGQARCWGTNSSGELGNGTTGGSSAAPVAVTGLSGATQISSGDNHTCVLVAGGQVRCWGTNSSGQLGNGTFVDSATPVAVTGLSGATQISGGGSDHTCVLVTGGQARCWGSNSAGQLGNGTTTSSSTPVAVTGLSGATLITTGDRHTCALITSGQARCWGTNSSGELGNGTTGGTSATPVAVTGLSGATQISSGDNHTCVIVTGGQARCWGLNNLGQLGSGTGGGLQASPLPVGVTGLSGATQITARASHSCVLVTGGQARCWGLNFFATLGVGDTITSATVAAVPGISSAAQLEAGSSHTCAIVTGGQVRCWGDNTYGQLGNGEPLAGTLLVISSAPVAVSGVSGASHIDGGDFHTCALVTGGQARCWGTNTRGQLGNGLSGGVSATPVAVTGLSGATQISVGASHACVLVTGGQVRCWGSNSAGQLGNGTSVDSATPVAVTGLSGATQISAGSRHTCALVTGGQVRCWGINASGQLGNGTFVDSATPVAVTGLSGATQITVGTSHTCVLVTGGQVRCWGINNFGQLGAGVVGGSSATLVAVTGLSGATQISSGDSHTCALVTGGQARCWGKNDAGGLGNGTTGGSSATPVGVTGLSGATRIAPGAAHTCALVAGGQARCWGSNFVGQLGLTRLILSTAPVTVV